MQRELVTDYLRKSGVKPAQAEALSRIFDEMATRADLKRELETLKADLTWRIIAAMSFLAVTLTLLDMFID